MPKADLSINEGEYAPVAARIRLFYERYPTGRILTHLVRRTELDVVFRAEVFRTAGEREPAATGWASERERDGDVNTVACLENTETSAVGRALANLGLTASLQRASREEMEKASRTRSGRHGPSTRRESEQRPTRERLPTGVDGMQRNADNATEIMSLLVRAAGLGLSPGKVRALRDHVLSLDADAATLARLDRRIRDWLERQLDRIDRLW